MVSSLRKASLYTKRFEKTEYMSTCLLTVAKMFRPQGLQAMCNTRPAQPSHGNSITSFSAPVSTLQIRNMPFSDPVAM